MQRTYHALFKNTFDRSLDIVIFPLGIQAEAARSQLRSQDAEVISFQAEARLILRWNSPIHLVYSHEDHGIRIHAAFGSVPEMHEFLYHHFGESPCHQTTGYMANALFKSEPQAGRLTILKRA